MCSLISVGRVRKEAMMKEIGGGGGGCPGMETDLTDDGCGCCCKDLS